MDECYKGDGIEEVVENESAALQDCRFSNECLEGLINQERVHLRAPHQQVAVNVPLPREARAAAVHMLGGLALRIGLNPDGFQTAVALLDTYWIKASARVELEDLPSICASIGKLVHKSNRCTAQHYNQPPSPAFSQAAAWLAAWLHAHGLVTVPIAEERRAINEARIFKVLEGRLDVPTVDLWMQALDERSDITTGEKQQLAVFFVWMRAKGHDLMRQVLMHITVFEFSPRSVALGFLLHGSRAAGLTRRGLARPMHWLGEPTESILGPGSPAELSDKDLMIQLLTKVTGAGELELQEHALLLAGMANEFLG
mmetsp:Transcript_95368/g.273478  ORF Transcript_95368/g.273478 Transcript_95368/m.273478 type:complete len:313 (+) Transcript_95368:87-1025(+)